MPPLAAIDTATLAQIALFVIAGVGTAIGLMFRTGRAVEAHSRVVAKSAEDSAAALTAARAAQDSAAQAERVAENAAEIAARADSEATTAARNASAVAGTLGRIEERLGGFGRLLEEVREDVKRLDRGPRT